MSLDLVCKTFYDFWFYESSGSHSQFYGDGSSVSIEVSKKTEQIVDMMRRMPTHQPLVTVIKCNLALDFFFHSPLKLLVSTLYHLLQFVSVVSLCAIACWRKYYR
ncbi:sister chromatid cohesion protein SCC2-like [Ipomoea triloba]|uniref:sister chromatid cohesion protein SCC2-like n=1 Tax=Ipomoea triloba TaxID=35885 RepID=UPI00125D9243|nr:sister chromatid cohesion protein SCC2-like [Ipomoea triloba]